MSDAPPLDAEAYIRERINPQIDWYTRAAARAKQAQQGLALTQLFTTAAIPVVNTMPGMVNAAIVTSVLAGCAAIATGLQSMGKHQENWLRYRRTLAALESAQARFTYRLPPFDGTDRAQLFIEAAEEILRGETEQWQTEMAKPVTKGAGRVTIQDSRKIKK